MKWRLIPLETHDAFLNMAIDEAVSEAVAAGEVLPTIRFYRWKPSAVSIGCFQSLEEEVSREFCESKGIDVVRRRTGGGAVYHDYDNEITYSVIAPESAFGGVTESYHEICGWIVQGFARLGLEASFKPINDVIIGGKKVSGNAQTRRGGVLLQHGTILYGVDIRTMFSCLKVDPAKISDKMIAAVEERVTSLQHLKPELSYEQVLEAMLAAFCEGKEVQESALSASELERAKQLAEERYRSAEWNLQR